MVYIDDWNDFAARAEALMLAQPLKVWARFFFFSSFVSSPDAHTAPIQTRYVLKYRASDAKLVLKVTDDVVVRLLLAGGQPCCPFSPRSSVGHSV